MRPPVRIRSIGTKVTEQQFQQLEERAHAEGLTISEWARNALLERHSDRAQNQFEVLLAELIATRTILINLTFSLGQSTPLDADALRELLLKVDECKLQRAQDSFQKIASISVQNA